MANWRCPAILREARHHPCQHCGADDDTIVAAHSNQYIHGKGGAIKAHDCFIAFLCFRCHQIVDGNGNFPQLTRELIWNIAHKNTLKIKQVQKLLDQRAQMLLQAFASDS